MSECSVTFDPYENIYREIELTEDVVKAYGLDAWARGFSLMTAGYRDQLNPTDPHDNRVMFNSIILAILGTAKARVFGAYLKEGETSHVHVGGEVRPHTQDFIAMLARIYAAHGIRVHLRSGVRTTPIWYSSFGVFYKGYQSGDNMTASHSPFFKGGWKPMDGEGQQILKEETEMIREVRAIVEGRATIRLAPFDSPMIRKDFDVDEAYVAYVRSIISERSREEMAKAVADGRRIKACTVGGSMKATTERLFPKLGLPVGESLSYIFGDEDSEFHGIGQVGGENVGPDPGKAEVYKNIGAQEILLSGEADLVVCWDPDGDRFNVITMAHGREAERYMQLGLEVEQHPERGSVIVYFTPNQVFLMLAAYRLGVLKETGDLDKYDWFVAPSISTSRAIGEIAARYGLPMVQVRVGFKYMGSLCGWLEGRSDVSEAFMNAVNEEVRIGPNPRALIMCEESGGAVFGGTELLRNEAGSKGMIALREKDGLQFGFMTMTLAAHLFNAGRSFADYYCGLIEEYDITYRFFDRADVPLYKEDLPPAELRKAKSDGVLVRDRVMAYFKTMAERVETGMTMAEAASDLNSRLGGGQEPLPMPVKIRKVGEGKLLEGTLLEFEEFWFLIRASGTDALLRYYLEGKDAGMLKQYQASLISLNI